MDPLQFTAARHISPARKPAAEEIDAFYEENAFEALHSARFALVKSARFLRAATSRFARTAPIAPEIASTDGRA